MKKLLFIPLLLIAGMLTAQKDDAAKYASIITEAGLQQHLNIIASAEMEGRETGTEGQRKAAAYIEGQFQALGLTASATLNGYQQYYPLYSKRLLESKVSIGNNELTFGQEYIIPFQENEGISIKANEFIFAGYGIEDEKYSDYKNIQVAGKVIVIFLGEPKNAEGNYIVSGSNKPSEWTYPGLSNKLELAARKGVKAVLLINPNMDKPSSRMIANSKQTNPQYPEKPSINQAKYILITHEYAAQLIPGFGHLLKMAKMKNEFTDTEAWTKKIKFKLKYKKYTEKITASNVLGLIEGTDKKDEYVFITAHYDHLGMHDGKIYYGADDDGSGTCAVIEMATAFAKAKADGKGPRRTIVFMTVSGEEKGLWGSKYYTDNPVFPLHKTSVDLNIDMIGRIDTERKKDDTLNYVYVVGHDKISSEMPLINEAVNSKYTGLVLDYKFDDPNDPEKIYFRSDHYNFARKGVPVLFFYDGMLKADYHKPTDTVDKINWPLYEKRTRMIFHTAWEMANRNNMLIRDKPIPTMTR